MVNSVQRSEQNSHRNPERKTLSQVISVGNKYSLGIWYGGHMCYSLEETLSRFCPSPENFQEMNIKNHGPIYSGKGNF